MSDALGYADYRDGGLERLREARFLLAQEMFAGSVYLGGRAVESILRAVIWKHDLEIRTGRKSLETGHDLRQLLEAVIALGVLRLYEHRVELAGDIQDLARLWYNNMRFYPTRKLKSRWWNLGEIDRRRTLKLAAGEFYNLCYDVIQRCEAL